MTGTMAAVCVGDHAAMETWGAQAEERVDLADPCLAALIFVYRAAIAVVPDPDRARRLFDAAQNAAEHSGSRLAQGYVKAWQLHFDLCTPEGRALPHIWSAAEYGGTESVGWETAAAAATIHEARLGNLAEAHELSAVYEAYRRESAYGRAASLAHETLMMALAAEPPVAMETARTAMRDLDRTSDAVCHPEMVLAVAIAYARSGDDVRALPISMSCDDPRCSSSFTTNSAETLPIRFGPDWTPRRSRRPRLRRPASTSRRYSTASSAHDACQNRAARHLEARGHEAP